MSCIWLNRPLADSASTASALAALGIESVIAPLTSIVARDVAQPLAGPILLTSRHAVHALPKAHAAPVFCVGQSTAEAARQAGCTQVIAGDGDVLQLLPTIAATLPAGSELAYLSGEDIQVDVVPLLAARHIHVTRHIAYEAIAATTLPQELRDAWPSLTGVAFFSSRSAAIGCQLIQSAGLPTGQLTAYCMSLNVVQAAAALPWRRLQAAHVPTQAAMLAMMAA